MEAAPFPDPLEEEEVRAAGAELDVRGADDRAAVEVRRDLGVVRLGHAGDLLRLEQAADAAEVQLQDRGGARLEHAGELVLRRQPLAGRDRDRRRPRDARHLLGHLGRRRLLEPERVVRLEPLREADRTRRRELAVRAEEQVAAVADRLAHARARTARSARAPRGPAAGDRTSSSARPGRTSSAVKPAAMYCRGPLGGEVGIEVDVGRVSRLAGRGRCSPRSRSCTRPPSSS